MLEKVAKLVIDHDFFLDQSGSNLLQLVIIAFVSPKELDNSRYGQKNFLPDALPQLLVHSLNSYVKKPAFVDGQLLAQVQHTIRGHILLMTGKRLEGCSVFFYIIIRRLNIYPAFLFLV